MQEILAFLGSGSPAFLLSTIIRLVLATLCGSIVGNERENDRHPAGIRTHALVCLGAALVMVLSEYIFNLHGTGDLTRMGAQVISGIGFLGAGTIIKEGYSVRGLTTAATLWAVSCVGLAIGSGFYAGGIIATVLMYVTLRAVKSFLLKRSHYLSILVSCDVNCDVLDDSVMILDSAGWQVESTTVISTQGANMRELQILAHNNERRILDQDAIEAIKDLDGVIGITITKGGVPN